MDLQTPGRPEPYAPALNSEGFWSRVHSLRVWEGFRRLRLGFRELRV